MYSYLLVGAVVLIYKVSLMILFLTFRREVGSFIRIVNRPSFIRPEEWSRITGRTGLASVRVGNATLCHRGMNKGLGALIKADMRSDLSHKMVINYDIAHVMNRHSLGQLTALCGVRQRGG